MTLNIHVRMCAQKMSYFQFSLMRRYLHTCMYSRDREVRSRGELRFITYRILYPLLSIQSHSHVDNTPCFQPQLMCAHSVAEMTEWRNITFAGCWPNCKQGNFSYGPEMSVCPIQCSFKG